MFLLLSQPERDNKLLSPKRKTKALDLTIRAHPETEGFGAFTLTGAPPFLSCSSHSQTLGHLKSLKGSPHTDNPPCDLQLGFTNYLKFSFLNKMPCKSCRRKKSQKQTFFSCSALRDTASLTGRLATERVRSVPRPTLSLLPSAARLPVPLLVPVTVSLLCLQLSSACLPALLRAPPVTVLTTHHTAGSTVLEYKADPDTVSPPRTSQTSEEEMPAKLSNSQQKEEAPAD